MKDQILRNGVPHTVTTSLVTNNAVLPQNTFIQDSASALGDSGLADTAPTPVPGDPATELQKIPSKAPQDPAPSYPTAKDSLKANDPLTNIKSHIRDNIQALKNLAHSDNWQRVPVDKFNANVQEIGPTKNLQDNPQNAHEKSVADNFQSLGTSRSIEENKLYLEKKSIKSNRQLISKTTTERPEPNLTSPIDKKQSGLHFRKKLIWGDRDSRD